MSDRENHIQFQMNYCQHYGHCEGKSKRPGSTMECKAGMDLDKIHKVPVGDKGMKWGPCISGHLLENPTAYCPHWIRRTREMGEARADAIGKAMNKMTVTMPVVSAWRVKPKPRLDRRETIECPVCKGKLHLSQSSYNGHVHAHCETPECVSWME